MKCFNLKCIRKQNLFNYMRMQFYDIRISGKVFISSWLTITLRSMKCFRVNGLFFDVFIIGTIFNFLFKKGRKRILSYHPWTAHHHYLECTRKWEWDEKFELCIEGECNLYQEREKRRGNQGKKGCHSLFRWRGIRIIEVMHCWFLISSLPIKTPFSFFVVPSGRFYHDNIE